MVFLGRAGGSFYGNLLRRDGDENPGRRVHSAQGELPEESLEHSGFHSSCIWVRKLLSKLFCHYRKSA